jgi:hypothetical protein
VTIDSFDAIPAAHAAMAAIRQIHACGLDQARMAQ